MLWFPGLDANAMLRIALRLPGRSRLQSLGMVKDETAL